MTDDAKVVGHQTDDSGETYGVKGEVDSEDGYGLYTPNDVKVEGALETAVLSGDLTDGEAVTALAGSGLDVDGGELTVTTGGGNGSNWQDAGDGLLEPTGEFTGARVDDLRVDETVEATGEWRVEVQDGEDVGNVVQGDPLNEVDPESEGQTISGGANNVASGEHATVAGGSGNQATHQRTTIGGGRDNIADNYNATVGGGLGHNDPGDEGFQAGDASTIGGGFWNVAGGTDGGGFNRNQTVGGGRENEATAQEATVGGGRDNTVSGMRATVPGGMENVADGNYSFAAGRNATANHDGSIVFGDSSTSEVTSQSTNEARFQMDAAVEGDFTVNDGGDLTFSYLRFGADDGSNPRLFYSNSSRAFSLTDGDELRLFMDVRSTGDVKPYSDNGSSLGSSNNRWSEVWATNGTIQTSDARLKTNVAPIEDGLERVQTLRPVSFEWKDGDGEENLGLIAQEAEEVVPEAVERPDDEDGYLGVTYQTLVPVLIDAVQRQQDELEAKDDRIDGLETETERLREQSTRTDEAVDESADFIEEQGERIEDLERENDDLCERLASVESRLDALDRAERVTPADD